MGLLSKNVIYPDRLLPITRRHALRRLVYPPEPCVHDEDLSRASSRCHVAPLALVYLRRVRLPGTRVGSVGQIHHENRSINPFLISHTVTLCAASPDKGGKHPSPYVYIHLPSFPTHIPPHTPSPCLLLPSLYPNSCLVFIPPDSISPFPTSSSLVFNPHAFVCLFPLSSRLYPDLSPFSLYAPSKI